MNSIDTPKLRNAEYLQYVKDFSAIITLNDPASLEIGMQHSTFTAKINELELLYKKALASEKTAKILALDERRDDAVNGIYFYLLSYTYHFDPLVQQHAQLLLDNMELYGKGISRMNYQAETATVNNILRDWESKPQLMAAVIALGLSEWVTELRNANTEFNSQYLYRTQEYGDANPETIKTKRDETNAVYYALRNRIDALHLLIETPPSPYASLINQLNALTDQYNVLLVNRNQTFPTENGNPPSEVK